MQDDEQTTSADQAAAAQSDDAPQSEPAADEAVTPEDDYDAEAAELEALQAAFDDIRTQSADSQLVTPARWTELDLVPKHMEGQEFVDRVFDCLAMAQAVVAERERREEAEKAAHPATPKRHPAKPPLGMPRAEREALAAQWAAQDAAEAEAKPAQAQPATPAETATADADTTQTSDTSDVPEPPVPCEDIAWLEGAQTMYLYSRDKMTDNYAQWSYLAAEDNPVTTLAFCAREESRTYPRPMVSHSLTNEPFDLTEDQIAAAWEELKASDAFKDIDTCQASNGDVYYFSTDYLSPAQAKALAEWRSVEKKMSP